MNKRGTDKLLSVYWFVILIAVAGGVSAMVFNFYSYPYDVRSVEAKVLSDKLANCISPGGMLNSEFFDESGEFNQEVKNNILKICELDFSPESTFDNAEQFYFEINISNIKSGNNLEINYGNSEWKSDCEISENKTYKNLVKCSEENFYSTDKSDNLYSVKILSIVRKIEKNVK